LRNFPPGNRLLIVKVEKTPLGFPELLDVSEPHKIYLFVLLGGQLERMSAVLARSTHSLL